jgi:hypothetical protein
MKLNRIQEKKQQTHVEIPMQQVFAFLLLLQALTLHFNHVPVIQNVILTMNAINGKKTILSENFNKLKMDPERLLKGNFFANE